MLRLNGDPFLCNEGRSGAQDTGLRSHSLLAHLFGEICSFLDHLLFRSGFSILICINSWKLAPFIVVLLLLIVLAQISVFALKESIHFVWPAKIAFLPWYNVGMHMGHALTCIHAILYRNIQGRCIIHALDHITDTLHRDEEVRHLQ